MKKMTPNKAKRTSKSPMKGKKPMMMTKPKKMSMSYRHQSR